MTGAKSEEKLKQPTNKKSASFLKHFFYYKFKF